MAISNFALIKESPFPAVRIFFRASVLQGLKENSDCCCLIFAISVGEIDSFLMKTSSMPAGESFRHSFLRKTKKQPFVIRSCCIFLYNWPLWSYFNHRNNKCIISWSDAGLHLTIASPSNPYILRGLGSSWYLRDGDSNIFFCFLPFSDPEPLPLASLECNKIFRRIGKL